MTRYEVRLGTESAAKVAGCKVAFLNELTRKKEGRPPIYRPEWPATGTGSSAGFSFRDCMVVAIIKHARQFGIERRLVSEFLVMAEKLKTLPADESPLAYEYSGKGIKALTIFRHHDYLVNQYQGWRPSTLKPSDDERKVCSFDIVPITPKGRKKGAPRLQSGHISTQAEFDRFQSDSARIDEIRAGAVVTITIDLVAIHKGVRERIDKL